MHTMKLLFATSILVLVQASIVHAFTPPDSVTTKVYSPKPQYVVSRTHLYSYVPDGLTAEQYEHIKSEERKRLQTKDLGRLGPKGFQSRSLQAWQNAYERGHVDHTFAPLNYKKQLKAGNLRKHDIPYMVRGGSWDNSDIQGARRLPWSKEDSEYANGGYKKEQSVSILGSGPGLDWTGSRPRDDRSAKRNMPGFS